MTWKASTGLRNKMLDTGSTKSIFNAGSVIRIYSGTVPAAADDSLGGATLLVEISSDGAGAGINFDTSAASGVLAKAPGETWSGTNVASGTASFYRHVLTADAGTLSTTAPRIQGAVGLAGAELNLSSVSLTSGNPQTVDFYSVALPTL